MKLFALTFIILFGMSVDAYACRCMNPNTQSATETYNNTMVVLDAQVQLVSKGWQGSGPLATLKIKNIHKGDLEKDDDIVIQYNPNSSACGMTLKEGETYTLGLYDIRSFGTSKPRVGNYRTVNICEQMNIRHYLKETKEK